MNKKITKMSKSSKGSEFERQIAKQLSLWWSNGKRDDIFWRTSQSGGRSTQRMKSKTATANSAGDIGYIDACGKILTDNILIECKAGYTNKNKRLANDAMEKLLCTMEKVEFWVDDCYPIIRKFVNKYRSGSTGIDLLDLLDSKKKQPILIEWLEKAIKESIDTNHEWIWLIIKRDNRDPIIIVNSGFIALLELNTGLYKGQAITLKNSGKLFEITNLEIFLKWLRPKSIKEWVDGLIKYQTVYKTKNNVEKNNLITSKDIR